MLGLRFWQVAMESYVFCITSYSPAKVNRRFRRTCRLHLRGRMVSQTNRHEVGRWQKPVSCWFLARVTLQPWRWRRYVPPKCRSILPENRTVYPRGQNSFRESIGSSYCNSVACCYGIDVGIPQFTKMILFMKTVRKVNIRKFRILYPLLRCKSRWLVPEP
jgi:hypothetical protein